MARKCLKTWENKNINAKSKGHFRWGWGGGWRKACVRSPWWVESIIGHERLML